MGVKGDPQEDAGTRGRVGGWRGGNRGLAGASILLLRSTAGRFLRDVLAGVLENSAPADVARTRPVSRARYVLEYPGNWRLDDDDRDFDPDRFVDLNRKAKANYVRMIMGNVRERPFTRWGRYKAQGVNWPAS